MSGKRIKAIIAALLALLNVYFLATLIVGVVSGAEKNRDADAAIRRSFSIQSIDIKCDIPLNLKPFDYRISRDARLESLLSERAIGGGATVTRDGAGGDIYENENGIVRISPFGGFSIEYKTAVAGGDEEAFSRETAYKLGLKLSDLSVVREGGFAQTSATPLVNGRKIIGAPVTFEFENGVLMRVSGYIFGRTQKEGLDKYYDLPTLMVTFLGLQTKEPPEIRRVTVITPGFIRKSGSASVELQYGYIVSTDGGDWFLCAVTGVIELIK